MNKSNAKWARYVHGAGAMEKSSGWFTGSDDNAEKAKKDSKRMSEILGTKGGVGDGKPISNEDLKELAERKRNRFDLSEKLKDFDWSDIALMAGGGLLGHTIASSLLDKTEEQKRREGIWSKLLRTLIPLGVGGLGVYAGKKLGDMFKAGAAATIDDAIKEQEKNVSAIQNGADSARIGSWWRYGEGFIPASIAYSGVKDLKPGFNYIRQYNSGLNNWKTNIGGNGIPGNINTLLDADNAITAAQAKLDTLRGSNGAVDQISAAKKNVADLKAVKEVLKQKPVAKPGRGVSVSANGSPRISGVTKAKIGGGALGAALLWLSGLLNGQTADKYKAEADNARAVLDALKSGKYGAGTTEAPQNGK